MEKKIKILYVDDDESNLRIFKNTFRREYEILTATSGKEGLDILEKESIDLIITDQRMPEMTGTEFLENVIEDHPEPKRILLTGFSDMEALKRAVNDGKIFQYVQKPWDKIDLKAVIDKALDTYFRNKENKRLIQELNEKNKELEGQLSEISTLNAQLIVSEEESRANETKLLSVLKAAPNGIIIVNEQHIMTLVNEQCITMFGYEEKEMLGQPITMLIPDRFKDHAKMEKQYIDNPRKRDMGESPHICALKKDGNEFPVEISLGPIKNKDELLILAIVRDISERKEAEKVIELSEARFRDISHSMADWIWEMNQEGRYTFSAGNVEKILGFTHEELIGKSPMDLMPTDEAKRIGDIFSRIVQKKLPIEDLENWNIRKDGKKVCLQKNGVPMLDKDGNLLGYRGVDKDITEKKMAEEEILNYKKNLEILVEKRTKELRKLSMAVEQSPATVMITDVEGKIEYVNPKFIELTGYSSEEVIGQSPSILNAGVQSKEYYKELWDTIKNKKTWFGEICNKKKNGEIYWEFASISPVKDEKGEITFYVAVKEDITFRKKMEEELKKARDKAESANMAKSEFLANMSHEIRTPMNAILGFSDLLSTKLIEKQNKKYLASIKSSGEALLTLINDILDLSKVEAGKIEFQCDFISTESFLDEVLNIFSLKTQEKGLDMKCDIHQSCPARLYIDEIRVRQVLINLIGNAVKFTEKGSIVLSVEAVNPKEEHGPSGVEEYVDLVIKVKDTGIGISEEYKENIFESFSQQEGQSSKRYGGTGLGLAISKRLVELMNGSICIDSELKKGSTFTIMLRDILSTNELVSEEETQTLTSEQISFKKSNIIIADDVETNRDYLKGALEELGMEVQQAKNGQEVLELLKMKKADVIITDLRMPVMGGYELVNRIKKDKDLKTIPVIGGSASIMKKERNRVWKEKFDGFLLKPFKVADLIKELMRFIPYKLEEKKSKEQAGKDKVIEKISNEKLKAQLNIIDEELMVTWETFRDQQPMEEVEKFAETIKNTGEKYNSSLMIAHGDELLDAIHSFDIDAMLRSLNKFPDLVGKIKSLK